MKPRFFADTRDIFKYDLAEELMEGIPALRRILFVPMLTRDDGNEGGYHDLAKAKAGYLNRELLAFLEGFHGMKVRDVARIRSHFGNRGIEATVVTWPFTHAGRREYFGKVLAGIPPASLVLLDPDTGLETVHPDEKHLLFPELSSVLAAVDDASLVMVFQYYPRMDRRRYREGRLQEILRRTGYRPLWITDNQALFFLFAKAEPVRKKAGEIIGAYATRYPALAAGS